MLLLRREYGIGAGERRAMEVWERDLLVAAAEAKADAEDRHAEDSELAERAGLSVTELRAVRGV